MWALKTEELILKTNADELEREMKRLGLEPNYHQGNTVIYTSTDRHIRCEEVPESGEYRLQGYVYNTMPVNRRAIEIKAIEGNLQELKELLEKG